jgi:phosphatidate phosphatase PAH1
MQYIASAVQFYREINPATLTGAIDIIVVEHEDGTLHGSPFHVRFGKFKLLRPQEKIVELEINGETVDYRMKLGDAGEAFFVFETDQQVPAEYATSPLLVGNDIVEEESVEPLDLSMEGGGFISAHGSDFEVDKEEDEEAWRKKTYLTRHTRALSDYDTPPTNLFLVDDAEGPTSDTEFEYYGPSLADVEHHSGPLSDTGLDVHEGGKKPEWSWGWGTLPRKRTDTLDTRTDEWMDPAVMANEPPHEEEEVEAEMEEDSGLEVDGALFSFTLSLCGIDNLSKDDTSNAFLFKKFLVPFDAYEKNPNLLFDPRLVVRYNERYYTWNVIAPFIASLVFFQQPLAEHALKQLQDTSPADKKAESRGWRNWLLRSSTAPVTSTQPLEEVVVVPQEPTKHYAKTLRLTSDQLKSLNLKPGSNSITFCVASNSASCTAKIFFWTQRSKVIISDIDGTITKSDALGHIFTMVGRDWTHPGIAKLYTDITNNGYDILYLTSRAIGQADSTRGYLKGVQQGLYQLPDGPVVMSPDRLFTSFHREVIVRKPQEFKMACLRDISKLFGDVSPFYAGFGNRITDALSYRHVNVPVSRIFTIDSYGELRLELLPGFTTSYISLNDIVDQVFPPVYQKIEEEFNDWNYWKPPMMDVVLPSKSPQAKSVFSLIREKISPPPSELLLTNDEEGAWEDEEVLDDMADSIDITKYPY